MSSDESQTTGFTTSERFAEGTVAFRAGLSLNANPHSFHSGSGRFEWNSGWLSAGEAFLAGPTQPEKTGQ